MTASFSLRLCPFVQSVQFVQSVHKVHLEMAAECSTGLTVPFPPTLRLPLPTLLLKILPLGQMEFHIPSS